MGEKKDQVREKPFDIFRLKLADKLIRFCLDKRIKNVIALKAFYRTYSLLIRGVYVLTHEDSNHHYIPKFLLKKFKIPTMPKKIYEYTFNTSPRDVSIEKEAALVKNLYSFRDKAIKKQSDFIEKQLFAFSLEKYASRIINLLIKDPDVDFTYLEESILTTFIAFQYTRTPDFFRNISTIITFLHKERSISLEEMTKPDFYNKAFISNFYSITPQEVGRFGLKNQLSLTGADDLILTIALSIGNELSALIYKRRLLIVTAREPAFFYLTGSPVGIYNTLLERDVGPFLWELNQDPLIFMPISPDMCIYYIPNNFTVLPHVIGTIIQEALSNKNTAFAYADRIDPDITKRFAVSVV